MNKNIDIPTKEHLKKIREEYKLSEEKRKINEEKERMKKLEEDFNNDFNTFLEETCSEIKRVSTIHDGSMLFLSIPFRLKTKYFEYKSTTEMTNMLRDIFSKKGYLSSTNKGGMVIYIKDPSKLMLLVSKIAITFPMRVLLNVLTAFFTAIDTNK